MIYNPYPSVELPFGKNNKWFVFLFDSMMKVDKCFIEYEINVTEGGKLETVETKAHLERVFAYELYRQWMNLLEEKGVRNLVVNGEIGKCLKGELEMQQEGDNEIGRDNYPDLVLHQSQGNDNLQILVCEIKRKEGLGSNGEGLFGDLYKLSCYTNEKIFWKKEFDYGVFILEGKDAKLSDLKIKSGTTTKFKDKEIKIDDYIQDKNFQKKFPIIVCAAYDGTNLEYTTLDKLIDGILTSG